MEQLPNIPIIVLAIPLFILGMFLELALGKLHDRAKYEARDAAVSLSTQFFLSIEKLLAGALYAAILFFFYEHRLFDFQFSWLLVAVCFVVDDFRHYLYHVISHKVRWAWASHIVHHSSQHFNYSTAMRQPPTEILTGLFVLYVPMAFIGFHPVLIGFCTLTNLTYQFFLHTEVIGKLNPKIEFIMNTPSHHRVHHSTNPKYLDSNFGGIFIIWDRLFNTFVEEDENEPCKYGIINNINTFNLLRVIFHEWIGLFQDVLKPKLSFKDRLRYAFHRPGWSHDGSRRTTQMVKEKNKHLESDYEQYNA